MSIAKRAGLLLMLWLLPACIWPQTPDAKTEFALGNSAYDRQEFEAAIQHWKNAVDLDPKMIDAHLRLGFIYTFDCPAEQPEDCKLAAKSYRAVLELDPVNKEALNGLAYALVLSAKRDEATIYYRRAAESYPGDSEPLYGIADTNFSRIYSRILEKRAESGIGPRKSLIRLSICNELRNTYRADMDESIVALESLVKKVESVDAMGYLSVFYRLHAETQCGNPAARKSDLRTADAWAVRACETHNSGRNTNPAVFWRFHPGPPPPPSGKIGTCRWDSKR